MAVHICRKLSSMDLEGTLFGEIQKLSELQMLILAGCNFTGTIPDTIGSLEQLVFLSLNSNKFSGGISASIGNLPKLYWLDMAHNNLRGPIPVSNGSTSDLDMMLHTKPLYLSNNNLSSPVLNITGMNNLAYLFELAVDVAGAAISAGVLLLVLYCYIELAVYAIGAAKLAVAAAKLVVLLPSCCC
ncbi:leucine-rich repeat receptor protein kinase HPCA1-like [Ziziphus jujuba]|uniref:Leucine-rich repeat receptor protein kinase HPCA1-like n=1 Tax=Ziziphus jujuba TaxID=326968 RepID=A0ABM4ADT4_ZIZJJ|nr:leucine-rich repeat receptor protein kinase HPCA1-like [Ziziphus jujuba]